MPKRPFIHKNFLLESKTARHLYHEHAAEMPVIDYHCHLSPKDLAENRRFDTLSGIWLEGDHYKWRAMRINGEAERFCTGDADPYEKFLAFARTVPHTLRNPLYHWTHLELKRVFGINSLLNEKTAPAIWEEANALLATEDHRAWGILEKFKVEFIGTTDDPADPLDQHLKIALSDCPARVAPTFRPDRAMNLSESLQWNKWIDDLEKVSGQSCANLESLLAVLERRMAAFEDAGCVAADHGIEHCPETIAPENEAATTFLQCRARQAVRGRDAAGFAGFLLVWLGERYAERDWVMQLHLGATRNVNTGLFESLGPDIGCDSITDLPQISGLRTILGELSRRKKLPKTILYNLNPAQNYAFATMCGNFFQEGVPGKVQFGTGWWFLDQLEGMAWQMNTLSNLGLISRFIGMLTDSRSFMSFPRHEYFRRLLCNLIARDIDKGLVPDDSAQNGRLITSICYRNAQKYFHLDRPAKMPA